MAKPLAPKIASFGAEDGRDFHGGAPGCIALGISYDDAFMQPFESVGAPHAAGAPTPRVVAGV
jgi:hypothetical protein